MSTPGAPTSSEMELRLMDLVEEFTGLLEAGVVIDVETFVQRHPNEAEHLRPLLNAARDLANLGSTQHNGMPALDQQVEGSRLGDFQIVRRIGRGGMGVVYEAVQHSLDRRVALKVLPLSTTQEDKQRQRFLREARAAAGLHHTHIVPVFFVGEDEGQLFYAMQLIEGLGLEEVVRRLRQEKDGTAAEPKGKWPMGLETKGPRVQSEYLRWVARIGVQIAQGLDHAHRQGILHRDIKPSNLLLDQHGEVWITDFGLAKILDKEQATQSRDVAGTLRYMPPERLEGAGDARGDVYSLGLTLYELALLRPAFPEANPLQLVRQVQDEQPPRPRTLDSGFPPDLETILLKATDKAPSARYAGAADLADDLERFATDRPIRARRVRWPERLRRWTRRHPAVASLSGALALTLIALLALGIASYARIQEALEDSQEKTRLAVAAGIKESEARQVAQDETYQAVLDQTRMLNSVKNSGWRAQALDRLDRLANLPTSRPEPVALRSETLTAIMHPDLKESAALQTKSLLHGGAIADHQPLALRQPGHRLEILDSASLQTLRTMEVRPKVHIPKPPLTQHASAYKPGTSLLATTTVAGSVVLVDIQDPGKVVKEFALPSSARSLCFDQAGKRLAVACDQGENLVLDALTGQTLFEAPGKFADRDRPIALSPDGQRLAVMGSVAQIHIYHVEGKETKKVLQRAQGLVSAMAFNPQGDLLAVGVDQNVMLWSMPVGKLLRTCQGHHQQVVSVAFHPEGDYLVSAARDGVVKLWEVRIGHCLQTVAAGLNLRQVLLHDQGRQVLTLGLTLKNFTLELPHYRRRLGNHGPICSSGAFHPSRPWLVTTGVDGDYCLHDLDNRQEIRRWRPDAALKMRLQKFGYKAAFSPLGSYLAGNHFENDQVSIWDSATGKAIVSCPAPIHPVTFAIHPSEKILAAAAPTADVLFLWDLTTGQLLDNRPKTKLLGTELVGWIDAGRQLLVRSHKEKKLRTLDLATGAVLNTLDLDFDVIRMELSLDQQQVAAVAKDGTLLVFRMPHLEKLHHFKPDHDGFWQALAFSPDGRMLATGGMDRRILIWDTATGKLLARLPADEHPIYGLAFQHDGRRLAAWHAAAHCTIIEWGSLLDRLQSMKLAWD